MRDSLRGKLGSRWENAGQRGWGILLAVQWWVLLVALSVSVPVHAESRFSTEWVQIVGRVLANLQAGGGEGSEAAEGVLGGESPKRGDGVESSEVTSNEGSADGLGTIEKGGAIGDAGGNLSEGTEVGRRSSGEVFQVGGSITIPAGRTVSDVLVVMGDAEILGDVSRDVVVIGGRVHVDGKVKGHLINVGAGVSMGEHGGVDGDVVAVGVGFSGKRSGVGGDVREFDLGHIGRGISELSIPKPMELFYRHCLLKARLLSRDVPWVWVVLGAITGVHLLLALLMPGSARACRRELQHRPIVALVLGMLVIPLLLMSILILLSLILPAIMVPFLIFGTVLAAMIGKNGLLQWLGGRLLGRTGQESGSGSFFPWVLGLLIVVGLYWVPFVGILAWAIFFTWSLGAVTLAMITCVVTPPPSGVGSRQGVPQVMPPGPTPRPATGPTTGAMPQPAPNLAAAAAPGLMPHGSPLAHVAPPVMSPTSSSGAYPSHVPNPSNPSVPVPSTMQPGSGVPRDSRPTHPSGMPLSSAPRPGVSSMGLAPGALGLVPEVEGEMRTNPSVSESGRTIPPSNGPKAASGTSRGDGMGGAGGSPFVGPPDWALPRVDLRTRLGAAAIDLVVVLVLTGFLPETLAWTRWPLVAMYFGGLWMWRRTSVGGVVLQLRVVRLDGRKLDAATCVVRALGAFLSALPLGVGYFWCGWDSERQTWHDKLTGTVVVRDKRVRSLV